MDYELYLRGGIALKAVHVPLAISGMREAGLSGNTVPNFREARNAQILWGTLPSWLAWLNFFAKIGRYIFGRLLHKMLDPFSSHISWPGRNPAGFHNSQSESIGP